MVATKAKAKKVSEGKVDLDSYKLTRGFINVAIIGDSPLICHAMSLKAQQELLWPSEKKSRSQKQATLKHDPLQEFRDSMYYARDPKSPTRIVVKATALKAAIMGAALDIPGQQKTQIGRNVWVKGDEIAIYGIPELMMSVVRNSDPKRTPDIRSRAVIPVWAAQVTITYTSPLLKSAGVFNLADAAGIMQGVGDWRPERGSGSYGSFHLTKADSADFKQIAKAGGKAAQDKAIKDPVAYDSETEELITWFNAEVKRRGFKVAA